MARSFIIRGIFWLHRIAQPFCFWILLCLIPIMLFAMEYIYNLPGPSTSYFDQSISSAHVGPDGINYMFPGEQLEIRAETIRHRFNGICHLAVWRVRENVDGKYAGNIHLMQFIWQSFVGENYFRRTSWPIPPERIVVDHTNVLENNGPDFLQDGKTIKTGDMYEKDGTWFDDPTATKQTMDIFVIGRYYCNLLDQFWPRFLEMNDNPLSAEVEKGHEQTIGFTIPHWDAHAGIYEGGHSRMVVMKTP